MAVFGAVVDRSTVEQLLAEKQVQYDKLVDKGAGTWQISMTKPNADTKTSEDLIRGVHPYIAVEKSSGWSAPNDGKHQWNHVLTFFFTQHL